MAASKALQTTERKAYATQIRTQWRNALNSIIEVGKLLRKAADELGNIAFLEMVNNDLPFTRRTAEKLMTIAQDHRLTNPKNAEYLPPHWTTLHELTYLDDDTFNEGIETGVIHADAERSDIAYLKEQSKPAPTAPTPTAEVKLDKRSKSLPVAVLTSDLPLDDWQEVALTKSLKHVAKKHDLDFEIKHHRQAGDANLNERQALTAKTSKWLDERAQTYNKGHSADDIQIITDAIFQIEQGHSFAGSDGEEFADNDIRNPKNPYHNQTMQYMYEYCRENKIITPYTDVEKIDYEAFINTLVLEHCEGSSVTRERIHQTLIRRSKSRKPENARLAEKALKQLVI